MVALDFHTLRGVGLSAYNTGLIHDERPGYVSFADGDAFVFVYWAIVVSLFLITLYSWIWCLGTDAEKSDQDEGVQTEEEPSDEKPPHRDLPQNIWSVNVLSAIGQAGIRHQWGAEVVSYDMRPSLVAGISLIMAGAQILALYCVIHDLDPKATPVTSKPAAAWVRDVWTVNFMKWFMTAILSISTVGEAGQCRSVVTATIEINRARLRVPRSVTLFVVMFQYLVLLATVFVGISAILSLNDVPNIIYSGMAITFITQTDELLFEMLHQVLDLEINFMIVHGLVDSPFDYDDGLESTSDGSPITPIAMAQNSGSPVSPLAGPFSNSGKVDPGRRSSVTTGARGGSLQPRGSTLVTRNHKNSMREEDLHPNPIPMCLDVVNHFLVTLPMLWGLMLITRAFLTNVMPNARVIDVIRRVQALNGHAF